MKKRLGEITISFRVTDENGKTIDVIKRTGRNKRNLLWQAERLAYKKHGNKIKLKQYKIVEETN